MPFESEAQRRKLAQLVTEGQLTQRQFDEFSADTPSDLPERVKPKKSTKKKRRR